MTTHQQQVMAGTGPRDRSQEGVDKGVERETPDTDERSAEDIEEGLMTDEEELDEALDETFPASDPISPSRIDGPI
ncbi:MAG: hypothetical protein V7704_15240 [Aurantimonas endophytica]|uniref:Uncharacterized protein n=1 Tax=Aurantimonas endophytica TaxID=1522175 RepID=A0A7W6HCR5_9HYPH|nr:hypothetical protein [Aurantimonas endophytica]MBB4002830.1 hypothetical protein [Aurantimonas endophytica]MCO6403707.1 hypothetical protein [Aurantimonas endophytica]